MSQIGDNETFLFLFLYEQIQERLQNLRLKKTKKKMIFIRAQKNIRVEIIFQGSLIEYIHI